LGLFLLPILKFLNLTPSLFAIPVLSG